MKKHEVASNKTRIFSVYYVIAVLLLVTGNLVQSKLFTFAA